MRLFLLLFFAVTACQSTPQGDGWIDLTQPSAWRAYKGNSIPAPWVFWNDAIHLSTGGVGDLVSVETFEAFEFEYEWRISARGNSGVMFHVTEGDGPTYSTGPEMQVLDNAVFDGDINRKHAAGACYALYEAGQDNTRPVGEWNRARILVQEGGHTEFWLNGVQQCAFELGSEDWRQRVAASKFGEMPSFGVKHSGHLALQDHNSPVWYRALRIRRL